MKDRTLDRRTPQWQLAWGQHSIAAWMAGILWLLAIGWVVLLWHVGSIGLIDETEPLFVEAARQMMQTGDWVTPSFDGEPRFDKPPLIYWLMVAAFKVFGVSEWSARLPSVLSALALAMFCFYTLRYFGTVGEVRGNRGQETGNREQGIRDKGQGTGDRGQAGAAVLTLERPSSLLLHPSSSISSLSSPWLPAWLGATMLLLTANTFFWGRTGYSDMLLSACLGGSLLSFFLGYAQPEKPVVQKRWYLAFYGFMALAVVTKGPIGILLPGLIIGAFLLYLGNGRAVLREMRLVRGALVVAGLSLPWYGLVTLANGEAFIDSFFGYHNVERFATVVNHHSGPWYFHILVMLVGFFPWSLYLPAAIVRLRLWHRRRWQGQPRSHHLGLFALFWLVCILGFFTIATTKYFSYTLPTLPAVAILVALLWTEQITQPGQRLGVFISGWVSVLAFAAMAIVVAYCPQWLGDDPWMPELGARLQASGLPMLGGAIWAIVAIAAGVVLWRRRLWLWPVTAIGVLAFLIAVIHPALFIIDAERQLPLREIAQMVVQVERPGEPLIMVGFKKPSLVFYTQHSVTYLKPAATIPYLQQLAQSGDASSALIVAGRKPFQKLGLTSDQYQEISDSGVYRLVRVPTLLKN